ncbi:MAG TPA: TIGR04086 family membrane protein [Bacilli bacterium]|nr:TIGR04086 family membrane protein [Bacilli bacterium]
MNFLNKFYKSFTYIILFILISILVITILNYINILDYKFTIYLKFILTILAFFIGGYKIGIKSIKKGWLEGLKFSFIIILLMIILSVILKSFELKSLIFYTILISSSVIGSMTGITKSKEN